MAKQTSAGDLRERVTFSSEEAGSDDAGGTVTGFVDRFTVWAQYTHLRGGEAVLAARLEGRHSQIIRIRASTQTRQITTDWRATDARTGQVFNIRDVTPMPDRMWIDILVQSGAA